MRHSGRNWNNGAHQMPQPPAAPETLGPAGYAHQKMSNSSRPIVASKGLSILTKAPNQLAGGKDAQYEDLKKKLLTEYKKIKKSGGAKANLTQMQKNQIEQTLQSSANVM